MSYNRFADLSIENALPCEEVEGQTYTRFQPISATNPFPVMVVDEDAFSLYEDVSTANPLPIALGDGSYTIFEPLSDANRLPVVIVEGQSYDPKQPISMTNPYPVINTTADEYVGPLDLVPGNGLIAAYSLRAMTEGSTANAIKLKEGGGDTQQIFALADNTVDVAAITTFLNGNTGYVKIWYDQSGNNRHQIDVVDSVDARTPTWLADSGFNSKPGILFEVVNTQFLGTTGTIVFDCSAGFTIFAVVRHITGDSEAFIVGARTHDSVPPYWVAQAPEAGGNNAIGFLTDDDGSFTNGIGAYTSNNPTGYFSENALLEIVASPSEQEILVNGVSKTLDAPTTYGTGDSGTITAAMGIGNRDPNTSSPDGTFDGRMVELLVYNSVLSAPNRLALRQNIAAYYGISL